MYNIGFKFRNTVKEVKFIARLELDGINVKHMGGGVYSIIGVSKETCEMVEKAAYKWWYF